MTLSRRIGVDLFYEREVSPDGDRRDRRREENTPPRKGNDDESTNPISSGEHPQSCPHWTTPLYRCGTSDVCCRIAAAEPRLVRRRCQHPSSQTSRRRNRSQRLPPDPCLAGDHADRLDM